MKFINLTAKWLQTSQLMEIERLGCEVVKEPTANGKKLIEAEPSDINGYEMRARSLAEEFGIENEDIVHINGVDLNLVLCLMKIIPDAIYVFSKLKKNTDGFPVIEFVKFVEVICR